MKRILHAAGPTSLSFRQPTMATCLGIVPIFLAWAAVVGGMVGDAEMTMKIGLLAGCVTLVPSLSRAVRLYVSVRTKRPCPREGARLTPGLAMTLLFLSMLILPGLTLAAPVPVTIRITSVECVDEDCDAAGIEAAGESYPDFYAKVFMNGTEAQTNRAPDDLERYEPTDWVVTTTVDDAVTPTLPVGIQLWDHDSTSGDDLGDLSPVRDKNGLDIVVDLASGSWSGETTASCAQGDGVDTDEDDYYPMKICFDITVGTDQDNDGLSDAWETNGVDVDGDGTIDLDLPAWGASPTHADVFLELDYEAGRSPSKPAVAAMKRAFATAPWPNPDGTTGITLHVDVGPLVDPFAFESGFRNTCTNGIDDDGDGQVDLLDTSCRFAEFSEEVTGDCGDGADTDGDGPDATDPQCRVGDDLGGGQQLAAPVGACGLDAVYVAAKAASFDPRRQRVFHYAIQAAAPADPPPPAPPLNCRGGQGELGGDDFISHNLDGGTLMHELGHNLNLDHGGSEPTNCKPNYLSVMNYNLQFGIPRVGGSFILDYSPPRQALDGSTRSAAPLAKLVEDALDETVLIDPADGANQTVFMNAANLMSTVPANANPNYSGDGALSDPPFEVPVTANVNNGIPAVPAAPPAPAIPAVGQGGCANPSSSEPLNGDNDWGRVVLAFRQFAASAAGAVVPPPPEDNPTQEEMEQLDLALRTTDMQAGLTAMPDPVASGTSATYVTTIGNDGPNPANGAFATIVLPVETNRVGALPAECTEPAPGTVTCEFGVMQAGETRSVTLEAALPADLVYNAGAPFPITATASVGNHAGPDAVPANDTASVTVQAVAVADLSVSGLAVENPPFEMRTGENVVIALSSLIDSAGPSSPMDTDLTLTATADAGALVSPTWLRTRQPALRIGERRAVRGYATLSCRTPGEHVWAFSQRIDPTRTPDTDPAAGNDQAGEKLVVNCLGVDEVIINVQPGMWPNRVALTSRDLNVAILTTDPGEYGRAEAFDATSIVRDSIRIGTRRMVEGLEPGTDRYADISNDDTFEPVPPETAQDGDLDLIVHVIDVPSTLLKTGDTELCTMGEYVDAATGETHDFAGCDAAIPLD